MASSSWAHFLLSDPFFILISESKVVQLFKVYQKQGFQNVSHLNFLKFAVQDNELDLCLTGAVGEHLK